VPPFALIDAVTGPAADRARFWESHILEVITGLLAGAAEGQEPRPEFDPRLRLLTEREAAKVAELTAAGEQVSARTLARLPQRYESQGLWGLVNRRYTRTVQPLYPHGPKVGITVVEVLRAVGCPRANVIADPPGTLRSATPAGRSNMIPPRRLASGAAGKGRT
jgi:hypothetical protein